MREGGSNSHAECRQEHRRCNQESAQTFAPRESGLRSPGSEPYAADTGELRLGRAVVIHNNNGGNYGSRRTSLAARRSNPDHYSALALLALSHAAYAIEPHKADKRYIRRKRGKFTKSQDDVGRSLATDRRQHAKRVVKSGEGDRGDRQRNHDPVPKSGHWPTALAR
jgi:hypothetical protein